ERAFGVASGFGADCGEAGLLCRGFTFHAHAFRFHLGIALPQRTGLVQQRLRFLYILWDPMSPLVHQTEEEDGVGIILRGGFLEPGERVRIVLRRAYASVKGTADDNLRGGVTLIR